jgi:hypothetical protein
MTADRKFRVTVTTEAFLEFVKCKLIKCEDAAALGDTVVRPPGNGRRGDRNACAFSEGAGTGHDWLKAES